MVQLQQSQEKFSELGLKLVGLSYDSQEVLNNFSQRQGITFPLLADPDSVALAQLGLVNPEGEGMSEGVAFPGVIYVDSEGRIQESFFEDSYRDRPTPGTILARLFPQLANVKAAAEEDFRLSQTGREGVVGNQWDLKVTFPLPPGSHLYAPGSKGYQELSLEMESHPWFEFGEPVYPPSETKYMEAVDETVPVFSDLVTLTIPLKIKGSEETMALENAKVATLKGKLRYQICTETTCYMPMEKSVEWEATVKPLDRQRAKESSPKENL